MFADGSARDVSRTNFVPARMRHTTYSETTLEMEKSVRTGGGKKYRHLERLCFNDLHARACAYRGESARDGVYTVQRASKDEVFVRGALGETILGD